ncbi:V/A-type H+-transporting ATPase subunit C [Lachnospiraceae bacterium]|nr:V/A-type H+-transporting ATPase subunit C [Lachnospiraceae bacterium]
MRDADYIYAVASIRAKEKTLLTDADIQTMIGMKSEKEVLSFLNERGWGDNSSDMSMEELLSAAEESEMKQLTSLGVDKEIIDTLFIEELYHNLKAAIKEVCTGITDVQAFYDHKTYDKDTMLSIIRNKEYEKLPEDMRKLAKDAMELMLTTRDGQRLDIMIDRACLDATEKVASTTKDRFLSDYAEKKVVIADIKIAVRAAITKKSLQVIEDALAPNRTFDVRTLAKSAANGQESVYEFLDRVGYKGAVEALKESFSSFEKWCDDSIMSSLMTQKTNIQSSGPIVAYFLAKQNEIRTARIIMTAKANGFSNEAISERVRKMYG